MRKGLNYDTGRTSTLSKAPLYGGGRDSKVEEEIQTVRDAIRDGHYRAAVSRGYYAMFYATNAILFTQKIHRSRHSGIIAAFGQEFTRTGEIDSEYHRMLVNAFDERSTGDYSFVTSVRNRRNSNNSSPAR